MSDQNPEIKVRLSAEDTGVASAIRQLGQELKNLKKNEQEAAEGAISLSKAFEGVVAIGALLKLEEIGKQAFNAAIDIGKMAEKTGQSTEQLSVFHHVAEEMGVETGVVDKALIKAAKSITEFEQGSGKAAKGFALLNIHQKDFVGLKTDDKIRLVTERLGNMQKGLEKSTAQQLIFSKGTSDFIPVANAVAREGYDKIAESASKLGILFSQQTVNDFRAAKAAMKELHAAGQGLTGQFLAGVLPSVNQVSEGLVGTVTADGKAKEGFKELGEEAGTAIRYIALGWIGLASIIKGVAFTIYDAFDFVWREIRTESETELTAISLASKGHFIEAARAAVYGMRTIGSAAADEANRQKAIFADLDEHLKKDYELFITKKPKDLPPGGNEPPGKVPDDSAGEKARADLREQSESERIAKAETEFLIHQLQSDLDEWKSYEKLREQEEKTAYEESQLTTAQYHERRRADIKAEAERELNILRQQMEAADAEVTRSAESRTENLAKQASLKAQASGVGEHSDEGKKLLAAAAEYGAAAAREQESGLAAASRQYEFLKKTKALQNETQTKLLADEAATNREHEEGYKKVLEFEAEILALQGKRVEQTKAQIDAEVEGRRKELTKEPGGRSPDEINAEIETFRQLKLAAADFAEVESEIGREEKSLQIDTNSYEIARKSIEAQQKAGLLSKAEAEKQINKLIDDRLPKLKQEAAAELNFARLALARAQAQAPQNQNLDQITKLQEQVAAAQNVLGKLNEIGIKTDEVGKRISEELGGEFGKFFNDISFGTESVGRAFAQMEVAVLSSLERIAAQMLVNALTQRAIGEETKLGDAEVAAGNVYAQVSAIPVVGWVLAPVAAAAAFAAVLAFEQGGIIPGYSGQAVPIIGHGGEAVLPEHLSTGLDYAIRTGSFNPPEALSQPIGNSSSTRNYREGDIHLHHNGEDAKTVLERELVPMIQAARRRNQLVP
jgi:hypothetical protein